MYCLRPIKGRRTLALVTPINTPGGDQRGGRMTDITATCEPMTPTSENGKGNPTSGTAGAPSPRVMRLGDLLGEWEADAKAANDALINQTARGPVTGFPILDRELGGALWPGLHILHGQPGAGKTAFALQVAAQCGVPCLFISCEMSPLELLRRITARVTSTFLGRFKTGEMAPADSLAKARQAVMTVPHLAIADLTQAFAMPSWLAQQAINCKGDGRHVLVIVDSLHSWAQAAPGNLVEYEALNAAIQSIRKLAAVIDCPVLAVAERNRASMGGGGLSAGAGTRKIEYGAETVIDLGREEDPDPTTGEVAVCVKLVKNRNGAPGREVDLAFHGAMQRFREVGR